MGQMVLAQSQKSVSQSEKRKKALAESNQFHFLKRVEITNREKSKTRAKGQFIPFHNGK